MKTRIEKVKLDQLSETKNNPRQISKKDFAILKKSLTEFPEMQEIREIVVDENYTILGGHQRVKAMLANGQKEATVKVVEGLSEEQKRQFVIKDNISNGEWDMDILANEWDDEPLDEWGLETGMGVGTDKVEPEVEFSEFIDEENNYILLKFKTDIDWINALTLFDIKTVKCYSTRNDGEISEKMQRKGVSRVLDGAKALERLTRI